MSFLIGLAGITYSLYFVMNFHATKFNGFVDPPSFVLLGIMPPCVMLMSHTLKDFGTGIATLTKAFFSSSRRQQMTVIDTLTKASQLVRSDGIGALVTIRNSVRHELLKDGISLIVNNFTAEEIRQNMQAKIATTQMHMAAANSLFSNLSTVCPGVGMIGTLLGLITMLSNMADPSTIGSGMGVAMLTTLYGLVLGTVIYGPWGEKIGLEAERRLEMEMMIMEGVLALKGKKSSIHLKDIMKTYGSGKDKTQGS